MAQITIQALREQYQANVKQGQLSIEVTAHPTYERWSMHVWKGNDIIASAMGNSHKETFAALQAKLTEDNNDQITVAL